ncbi:MAG: D-TA family PLP-dependent enzyme [Chitinophagaceae bacterium]|nr:D-TA family PLP-dependent enzyme [Chitinophagaceae bacterium]
MEWYEIDNLNELDTPALVIFPDRVKKNIQTAIQMVGDVNRLRPHIKTNKSPDASRLMIAAGIKKFKCATIAEAEMLAQCGAKDVLLAYQALGPKLNRFVKLVDQYPETTFSCLTDNSRAAREQSGVFEAAGLRVPVYIDLNVGMNRTGIVPGKEAIDLFKELHQLKGIQPAGIHAYDGHLRSSDIAERTRQCNEGFKAVEEMVIELKKEGFDVPSIIAGGSPAFPIHAKRANVECSPGTFVYWDKGYLDLCPEQNFLPAAVLVTRIVSLPAPNKLTTDLGHKSVAAENEIGRRIFFLNASNLTATGQSEEHLVLETNAGHYYQTGDVLYGIPFHVCPTVALYERALTVENGKVIGEWLTLARNRKITV